ncbi:MAG: L-seryl-tRNA(Sec) selenium transferase [Planctomycetes bacterium]|nr:L-seryl-tRNA(Sec) selenium transferase [Planctomycetota bacterium]
MSPKGASNANDVRRRLPSVDQVVGSPAGQAMVREHGREPVVEGVREELGALRARLRGTGQAASGKVLEPSSILAGALQRLQARQAPKLCRVINATGVILHTGLGRAVLPRTALDTIASEQAGYSLLEVDRDTGARTIRETHVVELLKRLTGAEAATVVNNNAGATMIALATLAQSREVIVSRGQLVEIGGSFRIPEVMEMSGARLVEVGTTNKTYIQDYERAIKPETALLLRVHTSNFRVIGFTASASLEELVALGRKHGLPVMDDLGSGVLVDLAPFGILDEPGVVDSVKAGADVVTFSGDKLLGGPQAGLLVGTSRWIGAIRKNPLFRALRVDKLKLTALEATLKLYLDRDRLARELPTLAMIAMSPEEIERRALDLAARLKSVPALSVEILDDASEVGGGSVPAHMIPTKVVAVRHARRSLESLAAALRAHTPCIFARVQRERVLFDVRTLLEGEGAEIAAALVRITA